MGGAGEYRLAWKQGGSGLRREAAGPEIITGLEGRR